jgi:flavin-dependent dehydrogenase
MMKIDILDNPKIQIYGAGMAGSFLYHLLKEDGFDVTIFDKRKTPDCRCGWGTVYSEAKEIYRKIGLSFDEYVLVKPKGVVANGVFFKNKDLVTFDRKKLLEDLWQEMDFEERRKVDIIIDATGVARAILPPIENDRVGIAYQCVEKHDAEDNFYIHLEKTGYAWAFPLADGKWHIGAGEMEKERVIHLLDGLRKRYGFKNSESGVCNCWGSLRMMKLSDCRPFIYENIVGVGESIGTVSGAGEGNIPSLISANVLFECLKEGRLDEYEKRIFRELEWVENEQKFVEALLNRKVFSVIKLLPKIIAHEKKRTVEHSIMDIKKLLDLRS